MQVGPRTVKDRERFPPNNILLMLAGAGLLWMGWTGFNGGDPYAASIDASLAVLNTHVCTAMSLLTWLFLDILFFGKPSVIGATQGMITGLVCITPAAGTKPNHIFYESVNLYVVHCHNMIYMFEFRCGARLGSNDNGNYVGKHPVVHNDGSSQRD